MMTQLHEVEKAMAMEKNNYWFSWLATSHIGDGLLRCSLLPIHRDGDSIVLGVLQNLWEGGRAPKNLCKDAAITQIVTYSKFVASSLDFDSAGIT